MNEYESSFAWYRVAGHLFGVSCPWMEQMDRLLPSYLPFRQEEVPLLPEERLFTLVTVAPDALSQVAIRQPLAEDANDLGRWRLSRTDDGFCVDLQYAAGHPWHRMVCDAGFRTLQVAIQWEDSFAGEVLNSFAMMGFAQASAGFGTAMIHASVIMQGDNGYAFLGVSGTGKSTHSRLWLEHIEGTELLNDDNPTIRITPEGTIQIYGTPWSGKTPCYKNKEAKLAAFVQLKQAPFNRFSRLKGMQAYMTLLSGCSSLKWNTALYNALGHTVEQLANRIPVAFLECLPDEEAARMCHSGLQTLIDLSNVK